MMESLSKSKKAKVGRPSAIIVYPKSISSLRRTSYAFSIQELSKKAKQLRCKASNMSPSPSASALYFVEHNIEINDLEFDLSLADVTNRIRNRYALLKQTLKLTKGDRRSLRPRKGAPGSIGTQTKLEKRIRNRAHKDRAPGSNKQPQPSEGIRSPRDSDLTMNTSYNDQIWSTMMNRGAEKEYTLPVDKSREEGTKKSSPQAILDNKVKADWKGETRDSLLNKADMLPSDVRMNHQHAWSLYAVLLLQTKRKLLRRLAASVNGNPTSIYRRLQLRRLLGESGLSLR
ncbi:MAG: hypothetical protein Q9218_007858 [Villophora microphyllina]